MPYTNQDPGPEGDKVAAFDDVPRRSSEPDLAGFEDELRCRLAAEPNGSMGNRKWRKALDEWIAVHPYVQRRALREAFRSCPRDARTAEEVAAETIGRLWQDLSRVEKPALGWDGRDSGFWPQVMWRQTMKTMRENDPYWARRNITANSDVVQAVLDNRPTGESADANLRRREDDEGEGRLAERRQQWRREVHRELKRVIDELEGRPGVVAYKIVVRNLDINSIAAELGVERETVLDHWRKARDRFARKVDLRALADELDVDLNSTLTNEDLIDRLYRESH